MRRILITGKNSYIGTSVENWLLREPDKYTVDTIDMKDGTWREKDFSYYDIIFHVAGIAHIKETPKNRDLYFIVNRDMAHETAKKAKADGVKQFIFLSTMSVYGIENGVIDKDTQVNPIGAYGKSKLEAEILINELQDKSFKVATMRPPMVYGNNCKGNYQSLAKFALITPIFPIINNKRSMIYIDNLSEFIKQLIDSNSDGLFFPQNEKYVNTSEMVKSIAEIHGKSIIMTRILNPIIRILDLRIVKKVFGDLVYDMQMSSNIGLVSFSETIKRTEKFTEEGVTK